MEEDVMNFPGPVEFGEFFGDHEEENITVSMAVMMPPVNVMLDVTIKLTNYDDGSCYDENDFQEDADV